MTVTNDYELAEIMKIIRSHGWIRNVKEKEKWTKENVQCFLSAMFQKLQSLNHPRQISSP